MVERLVGYAKTDLLVPQAPLHDLSAANAAAAQWCSDVNSVRHSEIWAVPAERLGIERGQLGELPSLRPRLGSAICRKVDRLSCVRFGSARYSVPTSMIGAAVEVVTDTSSGTSQTGGGRLVILHPGTGRSWPSTGSWRRARPASSTTTTAARGLRSRRGQ